MCYMLTVVMKNYRNNVTCSGMTARKGSGSRLIRSRELESRGISRVAISRKVERGELVRVGRGLYAEPGYLGTEHAAIVQVARRAPHMVFCLLTALRLHDLTTQNPSDVWIAIGQKSHPPRMAYPRIRAVRFSPASLEAGVETRTIEGVEIRMTNVAKTVADCFKFRSKVGLDVALEALREARRARRASMDHLWMYAKVDRVLNVMRPYLEAIG